jgi:adenylate cyclase
MKKDARPKTVWQNPRLRRSLVGAGIGLIMGFVTLWLNGTPWLTQVENYTYDVRLRRRGERKSSAKVVLVTIDNAVLPADREKAPPQYRKLFARWGDLFALAIERLTQFEAKAIGIDIIHAVSEPEIAKENKLYLVAILQASGRVVLPRAFVKDELGRWNISKCITPLETAASASDQLSALGYINAYPDDDGVMREYPPEMENVVREKVSSREPGDQPGALVPTFSLLLAKRVDRTVETEPMVINYVGPAQTLPRCSLDELLADGAANNPRLRDLFRGAVVIIGRTDASSNDFQYTPFGRMAGPEILANITATLLDKKPIYRADSSTVIGGLFLLSVLLGAWVAQVGPLRSAVVTLTGAVIWSALCWWQLARHDLWLPIVSPLTTAGLTIGVVFVWRQRVADSEINALGECVGPAVLKRLRRRGAPATSHDRYDVTVMFTDIRAFTAWSQDKSPEEVVELVNTMARVLTPLFFEYEGTFDKFLGDGLMAFFGAPEEAPREEHARQAIRCALAIQEAVAQSTELEELFKGIHLRIGLHSGSAVVDFLKAYRKKEYTALGDTVNLAARIQDATKTFDCEIVMSETTLQAAGKEAEQWILDCGYCVEGPCPYEPHNHSTIMVYALRKRVSPAEAASYVQGTEGSEKE